MRDSWLPRKVCHWGTRLLPESRGAGLSAACGAWGGQDGVRRRSAAAPIAGRRCEREIIAARGATLIGRVLLSSPDYFLIHCSTSPRLFFFYPAHYLDCNLHTTGLLFYKCCRGSCPSPPKISLQGFPTWGIRDPRESAAAAAPSDSHLPPPNMTSLDCANNTGGVISYVGSNGSSPNRTSPVSLYSDCSTGSPQSGVTHYSNYLPPSPSNSYSANSSGSGGESSPRSSYGLASSPGGLHVALDDGSRVSPSKTSSSITKLNGMVLLCKVCGDVASGFHYGVHACEGCKGFFRRSIQQNIQYKKCLKNETCSIVRINRNRCQQCRFRKCLSVGMSRDAVRFGRIPKREKQRMLAEMHSAMNHITSGQSHFGRRSPVPLQPHQQLHPSSSPLMGTAPTSLPTQAYSQYPQQLTPPTSPSPDHNDEVISQVAMAHQQIFVYANDKVGKKTSWDHQHGNQPPPCWSHDSEESHDIRLACPMNALHQGGPVRSVQEVWEHFSLSFTPAVREVVEFARHIPGFNDLTQNDQVTLLKAGTFEVLMVRFASLFDARERSLRFLSGATYSLPELHAMGMGELLGSMFDFSEKLSSLSLTQEELGIFTALVLVSADRSGMENSSLVEQLQETLIRALRSLILKNSPNDTSRFTKLLLRLPDLRTLNNLHSEKLLSFRVDAH